MIPGVVASSILKASGHVTPIEGFASYANNAGAGDRRSTITITSNKAIGGSLQNFVNGINSGNDVSQSWYFAYNGGGVEILFDFAVPQFINAMRILRQNTPANHGTWKVQASNDNATFVDVCTTFTMTSAALANAIPFDVTANLDTYKYYKFVQLTGAVDNGPYYYEIMFNCYGSDDNTAWLETPDYANILGSGARWRLFEVDYSAAYNGDLYAPYDGTLIDSFWFGGGGAAAEMTWTFPRPALITECKFTFSGANNHGTWQWEIYDEGAEVWSASGATFALNGATVIIDTMAGETRHAKKHRIRKTAGATSSSPYLREIEFKIGWEPL